MSARTTITSAISAVELAERIISGAMDKSRNQSQRMKLTEDLKGAIEYLRELKAYQDGKGKSE